jgi:predicted ATPase
MAGPGVIRTPDQRVHVFVSSALGELAAERQAVQDAVRQLRLVPVMFELGARSHPPEPVYRSYLAQSQVFVGIYWQSYGRVAPGEQVSGLEDEYELSAGLPRLIYVKSPALDREPRLARLLARIRDEGGISYQHFSDPAELQQLVENDLAVLLSERFELTQAHEADRDGAELAGAVPVPATLLMGREQEAAALEDLIAREGARLVTLTGPGGVGKSRLMVEAARRLGPGFADGARFVELASVSAADLVAPAIAAGLGLSTSAGRLSSDLERYLRPRQLLLALDNFEQVLSAAPLVAGLLAAAPGLVVLVTSRAVLRLSGEHEFAVPPLQVPPADAAPDAGQLRRYASVDLFTERAHAAARGFELTAGNAAAVAEICRRLDGLPLAIELAAARVRVLSPEALASRLGQRFSLLTGGARDLPERQQTLRNTLDWSYGLLSAGEQALLARLGVFAGSFSLPAADAIGADAPGPDQAGPVMDTLGALVDSNLVQGQTAGGEARFSLLETIREYALDRLREGADWAQAHDRHAAYFRALAESAAADLAGPGELAWLDRLETEHDNLWAAMSWLIDHGPLDQAVYLIMVTWRFWWLRGHSSELARPGDDFATGSKDLPPYQHAQALTLAAFILITNEDRARARRLFEQTLPLYRQDNQKLAESARALVLVTLGALALLRRDYAAAGRLLDQGRALSQELRDDDLAGYKRLQQLLTVAFADDVLGLIRLNQGDNQAAADLFTGSLAVARRAQDRISLLVSLYNLALARQALGDLAGAAAHLHEGLALAAQAGDETSAAYYLEVLAAVAGQQDNPQRAVCLFTSARSILDASGSGWLHAFVQRVPHDDTVLAALRSTMGSTAFEKARAWGGSAGTKRAVEFALEEA